MGAFLLCVYCRTYLIIYFLTNAPGDSLPGDFFAQFLITSNVLPDISPQRVSILVFFDLGLNRIFGYFFRLEG